MMMLQCMRAHFGKGNLSRMSSLSTYVDYPSKFANVILMLVLLNGIQPPAPGTIVEGTVGGRKRPDTIYTYLVEKPSMYTREFCFLALLPRPTGEHHDIRC